MKKVNLPTESELLFNTYHFQTAGSNVSAGNPDSVNWFINSAINLECNRKFLRGYTSPEFYVEKSSFRSNPFIEQRTVSLRFVRKPVSMIKRMLEMGYYVYIMGVDDFYVRGKSWYKKEHRYHDCLVCGYDDDDMTFTIYAYDSQWVCRPFLTPQKSLSKGLLHMMNIGAWGELTAMKSKDMKLDVDTEKIMRGLESYLYSDLTLYPPECDGTALGSAAITYLGMYLGKLADGSIPYSRLDHRIMRSLWDHRKCMELRIRAVEKELSLSSQLSEEYKSVTNEANTMRMLYAKYTMRRDDRLLTYLQDKLKNNKETEARILRHLISLMHERKEENEKPILG